MFWPVVLPFKITFWLFLTLLVAVYIYAMKSKRTTWKVVSIAFGLALIGFIPSCIGVGLVLDNFRFGHFNHVTFDDVNDFRIERYLPTESQNINLFKNYSGNGYRAKYEISRVDLVEYVDDMWDNWGQHSAISRSDLADPQTNFSDLNLREFAELKWSLEGVVEIFHSPVEGDGGGATYFHNPKTGFTLQRAGYW
jgi:hypothetical protein